MDERQALDAFGALSQETRLRIVRLLVRAGPDGMAAGAIGEAVGASSSNASFHLAHLERAGLIRSRREARSIIYGANVDGLTGLLLFLMEDCCGGRPEFCAPALESLLPARPRPETMDVVIYHNPDCGTSRNTLAMIRNAGVEPHVVEYLKTPPTRAMLTQLVARMGVPLRSVIREKGTPFAELGLANDALSDDDLLDAIAAHPVLINRPVVVTPKGVRLCRPSEAVLDLLPPQRGEFAKEDGERIVDERGRPAASA